MEVMPDQQELVCVGSPDYNDNEDAQGLEAHTMEILVSVQESSDESSEEDELLLRAELREQEHRAIMELELSKNAPIAFTVRSNIEFDGILNGLDAPLPSKVISFVTKEFLQIKKRFDHHWWIGRVVRENSHFGFIPSSSKMEMLRHSMQSNLSQLILSEALNAATAIQASPEKVGGPNNGKSNTVAADHHKSHWTFAVSTTLIAAVWPSAKPNGVPTNGTEKHVFFGSEPTKASDTLMTPGLCVSLPDTEKKNQSAVPTLPSTLSAVPKKKPFFKKGFSGPAYELVPNIRPVVIVGPALKGYEVTDMMQKALFDSLKKAFEGRLIVTRLTSEITTWKRLTTLVNMDTKALSDRTRGRQIITSLEVQREIERIFDLASSTQLVVLDSELINHPSQIAKSCLAPIMVYIKISSIRVLQRLIKNRGKLQKKQSNNQTAAAEKLLQCAEESFDVILEQNNLEGATEAMVNYLETYLAALQNYGGQSKSDRSGAPPPATLLNPKVNDTKALPPMIPGRPGLSIAFSAAGSAGFTLQELSALAGDRQQAGQSGPDGDDEAGAADEATNDETDKKKEAGEEAEDEGAAESAKDKEAAESAKQTKDAAAASVAAAAARRKRNVMRGGILKHDLEKRRQALTTMSPDRAHAIAMAEAAMKNANASAAAAAATRLEVPPAATIGLHQSRQAAHSDPSGTPMVFASRSSRQAKQRQEELDNAKHKAEEIARAAAEARAASGAQRQERRRHRRLLLTEEPALESPTPSQGHRINVKFGANSPSVGHLGPLPDRGLVRARMALDEGAAEEAATGSNLRRNTSSVSVITGSPKFPRKSQKPIPLIIHPN